MNFNTSGDDSTEDGREDDGQESGCNLRRVSKGTKRLCYRTELKLANANPTLNTVIHIMSLPQHGNINTVPPYIQV